MTLSQAKTDRTNGRRPEPVTGATNRHQRDPLMPSAIRATLGWPFAFVSTPSHARHASCTSSIRGRAHVVCCATGTGRGSRAPGPLRSKALATPNYSYEKRQRELAKKRKAEEKRNKKTHRDDGTPIEPDANAGMDTNQGTPSAPTPVPPLK